MNCDNVLEIKRLNISFMTDKKKINAINNVAFKIKKGEILGLVGESGSGKSITSLSILGLLPSPPAVIEESEILFHDLDLIQASEQQMQKIRGNRISMIFQEPMTSLNPLYTVGNQLLESVQKHQSLSKSEANDICIHTLKSVGLARAEAIMNEYPHQLSGGMRQRVMIAMAMVCQPEILIADEPTTALDVTIQSQILKLMKELNEKTGTSVLFITHDLGVVAEICHRVIVMYGGRIVEEGSVLDVFKNPQHPYTRGLLKSVPDIRNKQDKLYAIPGSVPKPGSIQKGCYFAPRCEFAKDICFENEPEFVQLTEDGHRSRCFLNENVGGATKNDK
ncbi:MAG: hypothetical protein K0R71_431 [Bacillales bacterium]|jgi:peptide/nickel transport system ATP-binding protein|nr:hypothetical protein [Bacillales bacterium]